MTPADLHVPDGTAVPAALGRTTDLGIGAHPDDLELFAVAPIGACAGSEHRWFTGITCTDGAGGARLGRFADLDDAAWVALRRDEQRRAADIGRYAAVVQLGLPSARVRSPGGFEELVGALAELLELTRADTVYTHDLTDPHPTHAVVGLAVVAAVRRLAASGRPERLLGCEGWRSLDWLAPEDRVSLDASPHTALAEQLIGVFESQLAAKRYDLAEAGRRRSNATRSDPTTPDGATAVTLAMDLTPLVRDDTLDPVEFARGAVERFGSQVDAAVSTAATAAGASGARPARPRR